MHFFTESSSGSSESINSSQSNHLSNSIPMSENPRKPVNMYGNAGVPEYGNVNALGMYNRVYRFLIYLLKMHEH